VIIRTFRPGDESTQVAIYNEAAAALPKFKPATVDEVGRRYQAADFDPKTHFFAEKGGRPIGYAQFHANGRVSFPWCLPGHQSAAPLLLQGVLDAMSARRMPLAFAAYRDDWPGPKAFFLEHGFQFVREMVNFVLDPADMPTRPGSRKVPLTEMRKEDLQAILDMGKGIMRISDAGELERYLWHNLYFQPSSVFVLRNRADEQPLAIGLLIDNPVYANPTQVDASMPCFRLGAFGTEGMQVKRIHGLFSVLVADLRELTHLALDLMGHAITLLEATNEGLLAAQVPSDAPGLLRFYQHYFRRQGSFPVFERKLIP
jgi:hypothetical protein